MMEEEPDPPVYERGDVLMDEYRLYVILDHVRLNDFAQYHVMILALLCDDPQHEHVGQVRTWGDAVGWDDHLGKIELPANM